MIMYGTKHDLRNLFELMNCGKEEECLSDWKPECNLLEFITCITLSNNIQLKFTDIGKIKVIGTIDELYILPMLLCGYFPCKAPPEECIDCCSKIYDFMYEYQ